MIEKEQIKHIAKLARLELKKEEITVYQKDLSQILDYFNVLKKANTKNVEPMTHSIHLEGVLREDISQKENPNVVMRILSLVPVLKDGFLKVKEILKRKA